MAARNMCVLHFLDDAPKRLFHSAEEGGKREDEEGFLAEGDEVLREVGGEVFCQIDIEINGKVGHFDVQAAMREGKSEIVDDFLILQNPRFCFWRKAARQCIEDGEHVLLHRIETHGGVLA